MTIAVEHSAALRGTPVKVSTAEDLRQSMASGLLVEVCVRLPRLSPPKSVSLFRPPLAGDSTGARLRLEALHAGPGFHQSAVCREVIRRKKLLHVGLGQDRGHELGRDIAFEQSVPVLGEHRVIPDRIVDANPDEPAAQELELQPFDQLVFRAAAASPAG